MRSPSLECITDVEGEWFKAACDLTKGAPGVKGMPVSCDGSVQKRRFLMEIATACRPNSTSRRVSR